jgi:hypothetical protein
MSHLQTESDIRDARVDSQKARAKADVLAQNAIVLRYAAHLILTKRAQKNASFSGSGVYVLAHLQLAN